MMTNQPIGLYRKLLPAQRFQAWRILPDGKSQPIEIAAATIAEAAERAAPSCQHKEHFHVLQTKADGAKVLHVYYVKQSGPRWVRKEGFAHDVQVRPLVAEHRYSIAVDAFAPVEMWVCERGADVVGVDRTLVEGRVL